MGNHMKESLADLGEISVQFHRIVWLGYEEDSHGAATGQVLHLGTVPEKALKGRALSHHVK